MNEKIEDKKNVNLTLILSAIIPPKKVAPKTDSVLIDIACAIDLVEFFLSKKDAYITLIATQPAAAIPVIVLAVKRDQGS